MTFKKAFESGCRFRRPKNASGKYSWPEGFYWSKCADNFVNIYHPEDVVYTSFRVDITTSSMRNNIEAIDWTLHPEDKKRLKANNKFNKNMEYIINED